MKSVTKQFTVIGYYLSAKMFKAKAFDIFFNVMTLQGFPKWGSWKTEMIVVS